MRPDNDMNISLEVYNSSMELLGSSESPERSNEFVIIPSLAMADILFIKINVTSPPPYGYQYGWISLWYMMIIWKRMIISRQQSGL